MTKTVRNSKSEGLLASKEYWDETLGREVSFQQFNARILNLETDPVAEQIAKAMRLCSDKSEQIVLECGCGPGQYTFWLKDRKGVKYSVGLDFSDAIMVGVRYATTLNDGQVGFVKGDIRWLPFRDGQFSFMTSLGVIEHFESSVQPVSEMLRCLKKGGILFLLTPNRSLPYLRWRIFLREEKGDYQNFYTPSELKVIAEQAGGEVLRSYALSLERAVYYAFRPRPHNPKKLFSWFRLAVAIVLRRFSRLLDPFLGGRWGSYSIAVVCKP